MKKHFILAAAVSLCIAGLAAQRLMSQGAQRQKVGPLEGGGFLLNNGWTIKPAGTQVPVDTFPMSTAVSHNGKYLLVLNGGYNPPSLSVISVAQKKEVGRLRLKDCFLGLTVSPKDDSVFVGGGATGKVFELKLDPETGALTPVRELDALKDMAAKGDALIGDVAITADGRILYATDLYDDQVAVINLETGVFIASFKTGKRPYRLLLPPGGKRLLVTAWGEGAIYQHNATTGELVTKSRVASHPTDMVWLNRAVPTEEGEASSSYTARLFVTASNTNSAYVFGASADGQLTQIENINLSLTPLQPLGMTPSALALDAKGTRLYAVCSDGNAVAAVDITAAHSRVLGFIPTGWYPTAVRAFDDGELAIVNGKGPGSRTTRQGPHPAEVQNGAHIQTGSVGFLPEPDSIALSDFTHAARDNSPYRDDLLEGPPNSEMTAFFSKTDNHPSPIQHVIYIIKANRTYDQVLGDLAQGNGDASLAVFGEKYTPNLHQLAKDYIVYDNFYENADASAEGQNWASAAIAPDYTVKLWPSEYGHRSLVSDFEGGEPANTPPAGYLWTNALQAGLSVRDYGQWTSNLPMKEVVDGIQIKQANDPSLASHVDKKYRGADLDYPDLERAREFAREWKQFDTEGTAPDLSLVRMANDRTKGTAAGALTPFAYNADNDYGVGLLVETVSHSKLWASTIIFVIEDDSQDGADHVDSHRTPVWVISPYTRRGIVDSGLYNQTSVLRTMELIMGMRPMTQFDAAARTMFESFSKTPETTPFSAIPPKVSTTEKNPG